MQPVAGAAVNTRELPLDVVFVPDSEPALPPKVTQAGEVAEIPIAATLVVDTVTLFDEGAIGVDGLPAVQYRVSALDTATGAWLVT